MAQRVGRPASEVDMDAVMYLKTIGLPVKDIAQLMGVSRQTLYNKFERVAIQVPMQLILLLVMVTWIS